MDKYKVMIVDDGPETGEALRKIVETQEADVTLAKSAEEALEILQKGTAPNLIILDLNLPRMSGGELLDKIRDDARWENVPVIPFSGLWNEETDMPFSEDLDIIRNWIEVTKKNSERDGGWVEPVIGKYQGDENTKTVNPKLILSLARIFKAHGQELSFSMRNLVYSSFQLLDQIQKDRSSRKS